jgi:hypothetical protein
MLSGAFKEGLGRAYANLGVRKESLRKPSQKRLGFTELI